MLGHQSDLSGRCARAAPAFGARGVGEPPLIGTGPAILSAIYDAIGKPIRTLPATPERVWRTLACS